jgi:hypothetical protein
MSRLDQSLQWLAREVSVTRDEFLVGNAPGGDMLLTALLTGDYAHQRGHRIGVSEQGERRLQGDFV